MDKPVKFWENWHDLFDSNVFDDVPRSTWHMHGTSSSSTVTSQSRSYRTFSDNDGMTLEDDLPGVAAADVDVSVQGDLLTISWKKGDKTRSHSYTIGADYELSAAKATMRDGMLTVKIPKAEHTKSKKIAIKVE